MAKMHDVLAKYVIGNGYAFPAPTQNFSVNWADKIWRRLFLPYGYWRTSDGAIILFNRYYHPGWRFDSDTACWHSVVAYWVDEIVEQHWFYRDRDTHDEVRLIDRQRALLHELGLSEDGDGDWTSWG